MNGKILNNALYYPYIILPNDSWFRTSILFWDTINPIVPDSLYYEMDDNSFLKKLAKNQAARPIYPEEYSYGPMADKLTEQVLSLVSGLEEKAKNLPYNKYHAKIYSHKMPPRLKDELKKMYLLKMKPDEYSWYYLYLPAANIFMGELARIIGNDLGMSPITDQTDYAQHIFGPPSKSTYQEAKGILNKLKRLGGIENQIETQDEDDTNIQKIALEFLFKDIIPTPPLSIRISELLKIKEDNKEFLYNFRNSFRNVFEEISEMGDKTIIIQSLNNFQDNINRDKLKLKRIFEAYEKDIFFSDFGAVLSVDKPLKLLTTLGLTAGGLIISPLFFIGLLAFVGYEVNKGRHKIEKDKQKTLSECDGAYIYKLDEEFEKYHYN